MAKKKHKKQAKGVSKSTPIKKKHPTKVQLRQQRKQKRVDTLNRKKKNLYSKIYRRNDQLKKFKRKKDIEKVDLLTNQISKLNSQVDRTRQQLGLKPFFSPTTKQLKEIDKKITKRLTDQEIENGFELHPNAPFPGWELPYQLDKDLKNGVVKWFIIEGKKYPASEESTIRIAIMILKKEGGSKKVYEIEYNEKTKTARYSKA